VDVVPIKFHQFLFAEQPVMIIFVFFPSSFFLPSPKVYLTHFSATTERESMKLHRNVKHYE
jgi:hypothetical protein